MSNCSSRMLTDNELARTINDAQALIDAGDTTRAQEILNSVREELEHY